MNYRLKNVILKYTIMLKNGTLKKMHWPWTIWYQQITIDLSAIKLDQIK